jgi:pyruvate/2-oxoglutarate dehydrogenase complex dihydrolipoamide dehydrogenase (E3) component
VLLFKQGVNVMNDLQPDDEYNRLLLSRVRPPDWTNPDPAPLYNLVVLGAGTAGLVTAAGAAGLGARVALVERHFMGGDCLISGCVPSKCLLRSSRALADFNKARDLGLKTGQRVEADFSGIMERVRRLRAGLSLNDSVERFKNLGVDVFLGEGWFSNPQTIEVDGRKLRFKKALIATGSRPASSSISGLENAGYLTNETVFNLTQLPKRLAIIGAGPIGCELAQAFQRIGSEVTLFHKHPRILNREDHDVAELLQNVFQQEGLRLMLGGQPNQISTGPDGKIIQFELDGKGKTLSFDAILIGTGRVPNLEGLALEKAGVRYDLKQGLILNDFLQTSNPRIYGAGDVGLDFKFTHAAEASARMVIQNALFFGRKKLSALTIPWCTYTDPEIAHVGINIEEAQKKGLRIETWSFPLSQTDRAITDSEETGMVKIHLKKGTDTILGATIVARHAGEMINEITLAMKAGLGMKFLSGVIHPYPTQAEAIRRAADAYNRSRLTPSIKNLLVKWLAWNR